MIAEALVDKKDKWTRENLVRLHIKLFSKPSRQGNLHRIINGTQKRCGHKLVQITTDDVVSCWRCLQDLPHLALTHENVHEVVP